MWKLVIPFFQVFLQFNISFSNKVDPNLMTALKNQETISTIVQCRGPSQRQDGTSVMSEILGNIQGFASSNSAKTRTASGGKILTNLINQQQSITKSSLSPATIVLDKFNLAYKVFWISSSIHIPSANLAVVQALEKVDVENSIRPENRFRLQLISQSKPETINLIKTTENSNTSWELALLNARCKNITCLGNGVLFGSIDSGVLWSHQELKENYKNDEYSWWDAFNPGSDNLPSDTYGHGTFTTGNAVGKTVGVAPNANWIACKCCDSHGRCPEAPVLECMEFMAVPWKWNDTSENKVTRNASKRPHVVNVSIGSVYGSQLMYPSREPEYKTIAYWNMLGIVSTFAAGNKGPGCGSIDYSSGVSHAFSIGSIDQNATISSFSSRGPVITVESPDENSLSVEEASVIIPPALKGCTNRTFAENPVYELLKPDLVAPGSNVRSCWASGVSDYISASGTSASAPFVAGVMSLVMCTNTSYPWNHKNVYSLLMKTADTSLIDLIGGVSSTTPGDFGKPSNILCNFRTSRLCNSYPNNVYGKGIANARRAVKQAKMIGKPEEFTPPRHEFCLFEIGDN